MNDTEKLQYLIMLVDKMIFAMQVESDAMPRSFEAPKTVDAIGVLRARAKDFKDENFEAILKETVKLLEG